MSNNIIAHWFNLPQVYPQRIDIVGGSTVIYLVRERGEFVCSGCRETVNKGYDSREQYLRDLSCFEYSTYLCLDKFRVDCPSCGVRVEELKLCSSFCSLY
jgi:transposase